MHAAKGDRAMRVRRGPAGLIALLLALAGVLAVPGAALASDGPTGFWYGTDSGQNGDPSTPPGAAPYVNPFNLGGHYGGYIGEIGGYWTILGGGSNAWNVQSAADAEDNHRNGYGIGTAGYWFMGGPGMQPGLDPYTWGHEQGSRAVTQWRNYGASLPLIFADVEPGQQWYGSGSSHTNRLTFNGFFDAVKAAGFMPGVYSSPSFWRSTFGTGSDSVILHTYEWSAEYEYGITSNSNGTTGPYGWCRRSGSPCAGGFGGQDFNTSPCALIWQWTSTASGVNSPGDVDQIDSNRLGSAGCA